MQREGAGGPLNPVVTWVVIAVVVVAVVALGIKLFSPSQGNFQKSGSDQLMKKVQTGGKLYEPPATAFPPGAGPNARSPVMPGTAPGSPAGAPR